jgi:hypothetical protein
MVSVPEDAALKILETLPLTKQPAIDANGDKFGQWSLPAISSYPTQHYLT